MLRRQRQKHCLREVRRHSRTAGTAGTGHREVSVLTGCGNTRVVVPLIQADAFPPGKLPADFTPSFDIGGIRCILHPAFVAAVPLSELGPKTGSLVEHRDRITAALDRLLGAY
ncbi:CcdB family protein [Paraburkholderia sp. MM5496-R1]|uniref:CcdB family protein n=1 Tax=Paraburkholderia sp. MM5496-R1 TaxID=2991065 RepID=UPI003D21CF61